jgi:hypothetical protein
MKKWGDVTMVLDVYGGSDCMCFGFHERHDTNRIFPWAVFPSAKFISKMTVTVTVTVLTLASLGVWNTINAHVHRHSFFVKSPVTTMHNSQYCTFLGYHRWCDTYKIISIGVMSPKVAKASMVLIAFGGIFALNFDNGSTAFGKNSICVMSPK